MIGGGGGELPAEKGIIPCMMHARDVCPIVLGWAGICLMFGFNYEANRVVQP